MADLSREGHRERLRALYLSGGMENAPDHNLLELLLSIIIPRKDVKPLAYALINTFGSIEGVINASPQDLMTVKGIGESTAIAISLIKKIHSRVVKNRNNDVKRIINLYDAKIYCANELADEPVEKIIQITTKNSGAIINKYVVGVGCANCTGVDCRAILKNALNDNAAYVLLAHNHPNGDPFPSAHDIDFTFRIKNMLKEVKVDFIDHIIVTESKCDSIIHSELFEKFFNEENR